MTESVMPGFFAIITRATPEDKAFEQAVGAFITKFAAVEIDLLYVVLTYADIEPIKVGLAMISPLRIDSGITTLKRVIEAKKLRGKAVVELVSVLDQLALINKARNDLLHYGVSSGDVITTRFTVHHKRLVRERPFSLRHVLQLSADIDDISAYLFWHYGRHSAHRPNKIIRIFRKLHPFGQQPTWRYRYPEPKSDRPKRRVRRSTRANPQ